MTHPARIFTPAGSGRGPLSEDRLAAPASATWQKELANLARFNCYGYAYQYDIAIPPGPAEFDVWGMLWGDKYDAEEYVYAVVTDENRYSPFPRHGSPRHMDARRLQNLRRRAVLEPRGRIHLRAKLKLTSDPIVFTAAPRWCSCRMPPSSTPPYSAGPDAPEGRRFPGIHHLHGRPARLLTSRGVARGGSPREQQKLARGLFSASLNANVGPLAPGWASTTAPKMIFLASSSPRPRASSPPSPTSGPSTAMPSPETWHRSLRRRA